MLSTPHSNPNRKEITRSAWIRSLLANRWTLFLLRFFLLAGFVVTILAGFWGTPVGGGNFAIIFVWIAWWTVLKLILIPLGGRAWCSVCPIPMPGEWLQQGAFVQKGIRGLGLNFRWPRKLANTWIQAAAFIAIGLFAGVTLTVPRVTAWVFLGLITAAVALSLIFERRSFCRYVCPMGGFIGWYSQVSPVEVRVRDTAICTQHTVKTCFSGCSEGYGCPWMNFPAALNRNTNCGMCLECLRTCPENNMGIYLRPFGKDLQSRTPGRLDEAWMGLVFLGSVAAFSIVFLGPWGAIKTAAYNVGSQDWWWYAFSFLALVLGLIPGALRLAVWAGRKASGARESLSKRFAATSHAILPLGFSAWIAFTIAFAFAKLSYILPVLSDPFGWGWNLLSTGPLHVTAYFTEITPVIEILILVMGAGWSARNVLHHHRSSAVWRNGTPTAGTELGETGPTLMFILFYTVGMLWLLVG